MNQYKQWLIDFGARLRAERDRQGLTRNALASRIDTKPDYIAQMERGNKSPSMRTLLSLLSALNVSPDFLLADPNISGDQMENVLRKFTGFLRNQDIGVVSSLYEIMRYLAKYIQPTDTR